MCNSEAFSNYSGVDDPEAVATIKDYISSGWLQEYPDESGLAEIVGGTPVYSSFACICKELPDGMCKRHIIMDSKRSGVMAASKKQYKSVLLIASSQPADGVELPVLDASDAYWNVPLHPG